MIKACLQYTRYVLRHKWFVFVECCRLGIPWRGLVHDLSKFLPSEFFPYARHFYGPEAERFRQGQEATGYDKSMDTADPEFDFAWLLHQKRNRHHPQWWCLPEDEGGLKVLDMPMVYRREMLADWVGAGRAQGKPGVGAWYRKHQDKMLLHPDTRRWIESALEFPVKAS